MGWCPLNSDYWTDLKQTLNDLTAEKDTKFHVMKLEDNIFIESFKDELKKQNQLSDEQLTVMSIGLSPSHDMKKSPGIVFLKSIFTDPEMSLSFLQLLLFLRGQRTISG